MVEALGRVSMCGMTVKALEDEIIPPNWRELVWDDKS
jgi:hypothetical protein